MKKKTHRQNFMVEKLQIREENQKKQENQEKQENLKEEDINYLFYFIISLKK
jgi:hypothetical protein